MTKSIVALITPFTSDNKINFEELNKLCEFHLESKTDCLLLLGTTAEAESLTNEEKYKIVESVYNKVYPKIKIMVGLISNITEEVIKLSKFFDDFEIESYLVINPYYIKTNDSGMLKHFTYIADNVSKPVIIYNVPKRTGQNISFDVVKFLSYHKNIIGIKEASGDINYLIKISTLIKDDFNLYCGDDFLILISLFLGCGGIINVIGNAFPKEVKLLIESYNKDVKLSKFIYYKYLSLISVLYDEVSPIGIKYVMHLLGFDTNKYRMPLDEPSKTFKRKLENELLYIVDTD